MSFASWDEVMGSKGPEMKAKVDESIARMNLLLTDVKETLGPLVDEKFRRKEGESEARYDQRRVDLLLAAAFTLFSNTHACGLNAHVFVEYVQQVATAIALAKGGALPEDPAARMAVLRDLLTKELRFGEDYALVFFSLGQVAWNTSVKGQLGVEMMEVAARAARAVAAPDPTEDAFSKALADLLTKMSHKRPEPEPAHAPTFMDGPGDAAPEKSV